jgi:hypothetical protein
MLPNFLCASLPSLEVIEHLENPRNFEREIRMLADDAESDQSVEQIMFVTGGQFQHSKTIIRRI